MKNTFELVGKSGKSYGIAPYANVLKDRFLQSGEESAKVVVLYVDNPPVLEVTKNTSDNDWNDFNRKYALNSQND